MIHRNRTRRGGRGCSAVAGAKIIDLMAVLRKSLSKNAVVTNAQGGPPIDLAERRALKQRRRRRGGQIENRRRAGRPHVARRGAPERPCVLARLTCI